jgi:hypothetical protein
MTKEDFLQIFKSGFHKLTLKKAVKINSTKNEHGRIYSNYLGLFEFVPPHQIWMDESEIDYDFLYRLLKEFDKELSNCIVRKFTKTEYKNDEPVSKKVTRYVFDVVPKNIIAFRFYKDKKIMRLVVKGYCFEK